MVVTFLLLLPTGVAISRYSRHIFPRSWFRAHAVTNSTAVMFLLLALTAILGHTGGDFKVVRTGTITELFSITCDVEYEQPTCNLP